MKKIFALAAALLVASSPADAAWHLASSEHFVVYADENPAKLKAYAEKLERFNAAVREARGTPDVEPGASTRVTLYLVKDVDAVQKVYGPGGDGVAGFYIPRGEGSISFIPQRGDTDKRWGLSGENIFFHEYTHHLQLQATDRPMPIWITEGFAEFFATPQFEADGSVTIGAPPFYRAEALYTSDRLPLRAMLSGEFQHLYGSEFASIYGRGWLLTHLLSFDPNRRGQLTKYLNAIQAGTPAMKAANDAFGDLNQLDRELGAYFKQKAFKVVTIPAAKLRVPPVTVRALTPGEAATIDERMLFERGGRHFRASAVAGTLRKVAARYPDDAAVLTLLSDIELRAERPDAALEAANRALAKQPRSYDALVAKGAALLALAKANRAKADWEAVRAPLLEANRIDREAAEPLMLFYRSYVAQGVRPTPNAVEALSYAVALAPQDSTLRLELVDRYIEDNRLADAQTAIGTLALTPGKGKIREMTRAIYDALLARNQGLAREKVSVARTYFERFE